MTINSTAALRQTAIANAGIFGAAFSRAPKSVTFKGKTYLRDSAVSVEQRLWYLAAAAQTRPQAITSIAAGSYSLDEVFGLDPDRSGIDDAERELRTASAKVAKVASQVTAMKRKIRDAEARLADALAKQKEAQKVQVGDIFTLGVSAAGRNLYADGQVQIWKDRIESLKTGSLVGMAGQEGWAVPLNAGLTQLEAALIEARAEEASAREGVVAARKQYDEEARARRAEEEAARRAQAQDAAARAQEEAEARAREQAAAAASQVQTQSYQDSAPNYGGQVTDPGYEDDGGDYAMPDTNAEWEQEQLDQANEMFGEGPDALAYAQDVMGVGRNTEAELGYVSPYSFDSYYGADCRGCDGCARGGSCDTAHEMRRAMLEGGWGNGQPSLGFDAEEMERYYGADGKITEDDDQGGGYLTPPPMPGVNAPGTANAAPFDFASIIPLIMAAVLALAPLIISAFGGPSPVHEATPPKATQEELAAAARADAAAKKKADDTSKVEAVGYAGALVFLAKVLA